MAPDIFLFNQPYYNALSPRISHYTFFDGMSFDYANYNIYYVSSSG
jgi:hypothetical protein